jgi:hypothetical protein
VDYDPAGMLHQVTAGTAVTDYLYDGADLVAQYDGNGSLVRAWGVTAGAASASWNSVRNAARNISVDGPSPGVWHANGRIFGLRWKQSQWGVCLDLHPLKRDPTNTPVLDLNVGPLGRGEADHIPLFDPRWFRDDK